MNLCDELLREQSKALTERITAYVGNDPHKFAELMACLLAPTYRLSQRAARPVSICIEQNGELAAPYFKTFIAQLGRDDVHVAVKRNVLRLLQFVEIPKRHRGRIFELCYDFFADVSQPTAVRVFAMTVAANLANEDMALLRELRLIARSHPERATAAFRSRSRRVLGV
jgi:hypothetical protein